MAEREPTHGDEVATRLVGVKHGLPHVDLDLMLVGVHTLNTVRRREFRLNLRQFVLADLGSGSRLGVGPEQVIAMQLAGDFDNDTEPSYELFLASVIGSKARSSAGATDALDAPHLAQRPVDVRHPLRLHLSRRQPTHHPGHFAERRQSGEQLRHPGPTCNAHRRVPPCAERNGDENLRSPRIARAASRPAWSQVDVRGKPFTNADGGQAERRRAGTKSRYWPKRADRGRTAAEFVFLAGSHPDGTRGFGGSNAQCPRVGCLRPSDLMPTADLKGWSRVSVPPGAPLAWVSVGRRV